MRRRVAALCAVWVLAVAAPALGADVSEKAVQRERNALSAIYARIQQANPDRQAVAAEIKAVVEDPAFAQMTDRERYWALVIDGAALLDTKDFSAAKSVLAEATQMPNADAGAWRLWLNASYLVGDYTDAAIGLTELARRWPQMLAKFRDDAVLEIVRQTGTHPEASIIRSDLLEALFAVKWHPKDAFQDSETMWFDLMLARLTRGDVLNAKIVATELRSPASFIKMRVDSRFDAIVAAAPDRFDPGKAVVAQLAQARAEAAAAPDKLEGMNTVAEALLAADQDRDALSLMDDALARIKADPKAFSDVDDKLNWTLDIRSRALFALNRSDEALAALAQGAAHRESGMVNVSQAINLADRYEEYDKPAQALAAVAGLDFANASPYGRMALEAARACPYFDLGDKASLAPAIAYMKDHIRDGEGPYLEVMLCTGDLDAAAATVIARLEDPDRRADMLLELQDYPSRPHLTRFDDTEHKTWLALRARPDVAAAIAKVGRVAFFDVPSFGR